MILILFKKIWCFVLRMECFPVIQFIEHFYNISWISASRILQCWSKKGLLICIKISAKLKVGNIWILRMQNVALVVPIEFSDEKSSIRLMWTLNIVIVFHLTIKDTNKYKKSTTIMLYPRQNKKLQTPIDWGYLVWQVVIIPIRIHNYETLHMKMVNQMLFVDRIGIIRLKIVPINVNLRWFGGYLFI